MLLAPALWTFLRALSTGAAGVALENLALRHQLLVLQRSVGRPRLSRWDRIFWVWLSPPLGGLADHSRHRPARHRSGVAPPRLPALLALEVQGPLSRPPEARPRASHSHPAHGSPESHLGPPAHSGRTRPARLRGRRADRRQVHAPEVTSALPNLARVSDCACPRHRAVDFFLVPLTLPPPVRLRGAPPRTPRTRPHQRHRPSHCRLNSSAAPRGVPG